MSDVVPGTGIPAQFQLRCKRCGNTYDARKTPPKQPCPNCEGELEYVADKRGGKS